MSPRKTPVTLEQFFDRFVAFEEKVTGRFEQMDARFEQMDARFEQIDARSGQVDSRFDRIDLQFKNVAHHIFSLQDTFKKEIARIDARLNEVNIVLDKLTRDVEALRQEYFAVLQVLRRIETRLAALDAVGARQDSLEAELIALTRRVEVLEKELGGGGETSNA